MAVLYAAHCDACQADGPLTAAGYQALVRGEDELVPLPHPAESATLHSHGYTFDLAGLAGRYARVSRRVCMDCAAVVDRASLGYPISPLGYIAGWIGFVLAGARLPSVRSSVTSWLFLISGGVLAGLLLAVLIAVVMTPLVRIAYRARAGRIQRGRVCGTCKSPRLCTVESVMQHSLRCPYCGAPRWYYGMRGIS